jgi:hypothetical protein
VVEAGATDWTVVELAGAGGAPAGAGVPVDGGELDTVLGPELQAARINTNATIAAAADGRGPGTRPR